MTSYNKKHLYLYILTFLLLFPITLLGKELHSTALTPLVNEGTFVLTVEEDLVSLKAQQASLKNIVEEIGRKMDIEVLGNILDSETISIEFAELSLGKALERLSSNYGYQMKSERGSQRISRIFVLPKGTGTTITRPTTKEIGLEEEPDTPNSERALQVESAKEKNSDKKTPARPEPFKFQFDPSALFGN